MVGGMDEMDELDQIGRRFGTDKSSLGHGLLSSYVFFLPDREDRFLFLEFGVYHGASARTWIMYFPNVTYVGIDKNAPTHSIDAANSTFVRANATDHETLLELSSRFEAPKVILDDASHKWSHQRTSFFLFWDWLAPGGTYIIEDLHTSNEPGFSGADLMSPMSWLERLAFGLQQRRTQREHFIATEHPDIVRVVESLESISFIRSAVILRKRSDADSVLPQSPRLQKARNWIRFGLRPR